MMRIAVIEPMQERKSNVIRDVIYGCWCGGRRIGGASVPPFLQLSLATLLKEDGFDVVFVDAQVEQLEIEDVVNRISGASVVIVSTSVMTMRDDGRYVRELKSRLPGLIAIAYGSHPTFMPEDTIRKGIDYAVQREPEASVRELVHKIAASDWDGAKSVLGVYSHREDGTATNNPRHPFIEDLDQIPPINVDFLPAGIDYFNPIVRNLPYLTVSSSHGCPAKCSYCTAPFFHGTRTRFQSAAKVLADAEYYLSHGIREIYYRDETFTANRQRVIDICNGILERRLNFSWICNARVDTVDLEMLRMMKAAGCHLIKFGAESGNQAILDGVKKGTTLQQARDAFQWCKDVGIDTHAHFMVGMPGDTEETVEETIRFALEIEPSTATFGICTPYPGTPLFRQVQGQDASIGDGTDNASMDRLHTQGEFNRHYCSIGSDRLSQLVHQFYRRFYLRPSYIFRSLKRLRNMKMLRNAVIGGFNVISFSVGGRNS